jgi:hypothetical protein
LISSVPFVRDLSAQVLLTYLEVVLNIYKNIATDAILHGPISRIISNNKIAGFVDDTALLSLKQVLISILVLYMEQDAQKWEKLVHTSGGKLEISKCALALFSWIFDNHGRPLLDNTTKYHLHIRDSETNRVTLIPQIPSSQSYKYVGIQLALDGNMKYQIADIKQKCIHMLNNLGCPQRSTWIR